MLPWKPIFLVNLGATLALVGLIWTIQVVHYPLFDHVGDPTWAAYHRSHTQRITLIVAPLMCAEVFTCGLLLLDPPRLIPTWAVWLGAALVAVVWASTGLIQVPLHNSLGGGFQEGPYEALVHTNWIRTLAWSARGVLVVWMASRLMQGGGASG